MRISWDDTGNRLYETGTKNGVLFVKQTKTEGTWYKNGVPWNGLTAVSESPSGAEETALYADDQKYLSLRSNEEFGATVEAYTYPDEWAVCDGSYEYNDMGVYVGQQTRRGFGMCYRTTVGNDVEGNDYNYKLHIIYDAMASPSEKSYSTVNDSPEAITFSWTVTTTPIKMVLPDGTALKNSATIIIDALKLGATKMAAIEALVYGTDVYTEYTGDATNPKDAGLYEKVGTTDTYVLTQDTTLGVDKTYYQNTGNDPVLPTPAQIFAIVAGQ